MCSLNSTRQYLRSNTDFCSQGLDFLGTIRLINYIRSEVARGNLQPDVSSNSLFEDDKYLIPVLEDDALLFSFDDISNEPSLEETAKPTDRIKELEEELSRLREEFTEYKHLAQKTLAKQLNSQVDESPNASSDQQRRDETPETDRLKNAEAGYFTSYAYNSELLALIAES